MHMQSSSNAIYISGKLTNSKSGMNSRSGRRRLGVVGGGGVVGGVVGGVGVVG